MSPTLQKILNALEKADSIPAKEKERLRKELEKTEKTLQKKDTQLSAQARELEIESALERIRARSMAMHSTEELNDVLRVMFQQIEVLGIDAKCAHLTLMDLENNTFSFRITGKNGAANMGEQIIDLNAMPIWKETVAKWKKAKPHSHQCLVYAPEILPDLWKLIDTSLKSLPAKERIKISDFPNGLFDCEGHHKFGYIGFNNSRPPTEEEISIAIRFAREFETVYQRFLDIKKAEAQTREAQIQLSLERVRARSMAMQSSEELNDVLSILFQQFDVLGIKPLNVWLSLYNLEENTFTYRATGTGGSRVQGQQVIDLAAMDIWQEQLEQWKSGNAEPVLVTFYPPEVLPQLMEVFKETFDAMPAEERMDPKLFPDGGYNVQGYTKFGYIGYNHLQAPTQEEKDILLKFATEFERVYQRFMEIKKAEGQAREAQIEAALERVRAASMAMHKTGEISEVVTVLFDQLNHLNVPFLQIWITILNLDKDYFDIWFSPLEGVYETTQYFTMPSMYFEDTAIKTWRSKAPFSYRSLKSVAEVDEFINACDAITGSTYFSHGLKIKNYNQLEFIEARHEYGFISKSNTEPPTETEANILQRFAKVFEQAYTRFLDIEKAEAQARESQIEAALEKVRSQSLAMHITGEMQLVANAVFEQLQTLGLEMDVVGMSGVIEDKQDYEVWIGGAPLGSALRIPYNEDTQVQRDYNKMLKDRPELFAKTYSGQVKKEYIDRLLTHGDFPKALKKKMETSDAFTTLIAPKKNSGIQVVRYTDQPFTDQDAETLKRFAGVFEQAYIRFRDLERAEAQAREAQIEASLERIRAKAMAMHASNELNEVLSVLFEQFNTLGINPVWAHLSLINLEENTFTYRMSRADKNNRLSGQVVDLDARPEWQDAVKAFKASKPNSVSCLEFPKKVLPQIWELFEESFSSISEEYPVRMEDFPNGIFNTQGYCKFGYIGFNHNRPPTEEEKEIVVRIANEFGRVYQRFLDLQKAEAQTREAQIEAALERVRTRTMAMHNTDDIAATVTTFFNELLGLHPDSSMRCGIGILSQTEHMELWTASVKDSSKIVLNVGTLDMSLHPLLKGAKKNWSKKGKSFTYILKGKDVKTYFQILNEAPDYPAQFNLDVLPKAVCHNSFVFRDGILFVFSETQLNQEVATILERFAAVFGQTYTRYLDLKKAEAQARESQIQLSLERVRARSLAMQSTDELHEVLGVLFRQFDDLGIQPVNVFLSLFDREQRTLTYRASGKSGKRIPGKQVVEVDSMEALQALYDKWLTDNSDTVEVIYYPKEVLPQLFGIFSETFSSMPKKDRIGVNDFPDGGYSMAGYTPYGYLGYDHQRQATGEEKEILSRFCVEFTRVYQRFLDIQKAEAQTREAQIEMALERVRSASMAMHKSKDLHDVLVMLYNQLAALGLKMHSAQILESIEDPKAMHSWIVTNGVVYPEQVRAPFSKDLFSKRFREAVTNGESFYTLKLSKQQKDKFFHHFFDNSSLKNVPQERKDLLLSSPGLGTSNAMGKYTSLSIMRYDGILYSEEENEIIKRFAKVLEQSYTRFLDIQKAETQAREAQIEAALEKVRSQSLAMHSTSEMQQVANAVYDQLMELGLETEAVGMSGAIAAKQDYDVWVGGVPFGKALRIPYNENTKVQRDYNKMLEERPELFAKTYSGKDKEEYINHLLTHGDFPKALKKKMKTSEAFSTSIALAKKSSIQILRYTDQPYSEEDNEILKRFSKVFEQAYIRFMDLEKAEAQARESQIEAALEKVRSRSLAMQKPEELQEVVAVVGNKLQELGVILDSGGVVICTYFPDSKDVMHWTATFDAAHPSVPYYLPYFDTPIWKETWASKWESDDDFFEKIFSFKDKNHFFHKAFEISDYKNLPEEHKKELLAVENHALSFAWQTHSALMIPSHNGKLLPEEHKIILKRFARVFEQAYIRFMDLQKAEAQARESKIEMALERVRSRTMAMHKSEELGEVAAVLFEQISSLTYAPERFNIAIGNKEEESFDIWVTDQKGHEVSKRFMFQADKSPVVREVFNAWGKEPYIVQDLHGKKLQDWVRYMQEEIGLPFDKARLSEHRYISSVFFSHGCIGITTNEPPETETLELIERFAKVFQQTYVRFLDLQKAEAQAREAQIEVALERVRSRAMAMHHTDELTDVLGVLFNQFDFLGINPVLTHLTLFDEDNETFTLRITTGGEKRTIAEQLIDVNAVESWKTSFANWKKSELHAVDCIDYPPEVLPAVWEVLDGVMSALPEGQKIFPEDFPNGLYTTQGHCKYGYIGFNHARRATEEEKEIVVRFAKEFGRLYQRFLDIQKAESQAREAKIEGALERVRSKAMAMHTSDDLADTVEILYKELDTLQVHALRFGHAKVNSDTKIVELHTATDLGKVVGQLKLEGHPLLEKIYEHYLAKEDLYYALQGEEMKSYYSIVSRAIDVPIPPMDTVQHGYFFFLGDTANYAYSDKALDEEELKVYRRLITVLNLTYKRYEELKNAETQAREAQIEGALERVRSKTMAMHNSEDLEDIVVSLFDELLNLGIDKSIRCGIGILEGHEGMETRSVNSNSDGTVDLKVGMLNMTIHPMLVNLKKAWKNGRKSYSYEYSSKDVRKYYTALNNEPEYPFNADLTSLPKQEYHRSFFFSSGIIFAFSENPISEESSKILARFAAVFGQTYQRFLDLQKAEERAKDAVKQASLDRVRGQIASMRSVKDLERITPLVWNELTILGIPFIRCGVFIIDDSSEKVQVHLSAPDGHSLGVMLMPFDADPLTFNMVENWRNAEVFRAHWNREQFTTFMQTMMDLGQIINKKIYQGAELPPESLHLHFVPFTQGMLYVGSEAMLTEEQIELVQSLADAFAIAYARYEDFSKLEKAKERVETTLSELKATQNQLVQSEKMASLGELTAGIAHEIQNPLNFVNNFSEVSIELIEEMLEEIQKGDVEEVKALAEDIILNLEKINHHGKRADGIVKGMLQHSRASSGEKEPTDLNVLADEYLRLAYHGLRAKDKSFNATLETHFDESIGKVNLMTQDMGRVILNLITNAFYAVKEKSSEALAKGGDTYEPTVTVSTKKLTTPSGDAEVEIRVKDNGNGIPEAIKEKIFQPFFTTKPTGQGTGLGLSMSYDIVTKGHGGSLEVTSEEGVGSEFIITLIV